MWIKICGNTRLQDCLLAAELGADAVGFIFAEGKRTVTAQQVAAITSQLPARLEKIGVFTSTDPNAIVLTALEAGLTGVQLHGEYNPSLAGAIRTGLSATLKVLQVVHSDLDISAAAQASDFAEAVARIAKDTSVDRLLVDSRTAQRSGGTGRTFDWQAAAPALAESALPVIVAGGLNPQNVRAAMRALKPWGVDVSSGIEDAPGVKNTAALRRFMDIARTG